MAELFKQAYLRAATVINGQNGFAASGIFPLNENIFPDWMYAPADITDNNLTDSSALIVPDDRGDAKPLSRRIKLSQNMRNLRTQYL